MAIARALVNAPKLILADEPTGALDSKNAGVIMRELLSLRNEETILLIATHNREAAALCDETLVIRDGAIA